MLSLTAKDLKADTPAIALDYARFVKTDTLSVRSVPPHFASDVSQIFIENNQGGLDSTKLTRLVIWGKKSA